MDFEQKTESQIDGILASFVLSYLPTIFHHFYFLTNIYSSNQSYNYTRGIHI